MNIHTTLKRIELTAGGPGSGPHKGGEWTKTILGLLPATLKQINSHPAITEMNKTHREQRVQQGRWAKPVNSMAYDTLHRLRKGGLVNRRGDGVYEHKSEVSL